MAEAQLKKHWGFFSPLMRRIMALNVIALGILGGGLLYLNQFRGNLIEQRLADLRIQAEIISGAIGESASGGPESTEIERDAAGQIIGRLVGPTSNRARLFTNSGEMIADSRYMILGRSVFVVPLPPPGEPVSLKRRAVRWIDSVLDSLTADPDVSLYQEKPVQTASDYIEVATALTGEADSRTRALENGDLILTVAVPVQRFRRVLGALMLSADTSDIENIVFSERILILKVFGASLAVTLLLSFFLAGTIARPIRKLAAAADTVRRGIGHASAMPEFTTRRDEIGDLSRVLHDMTLTLYRQLTAVESFAADVAHELKNPLSSLRSAVETLQRTEDKTVQRKLLDIVQEDVKRLDRLITDISDASRLDAELSRGKMEPMDMTLLTRGITDAYRAAEKPGQASIVFSRQDETGAYIINGIEDRIGQVIRNLIGNALSFTPPDGLITVRLEKYADRVLLIVEDEGPGLPAGAQENIFKRFYSERPVTEAFGTHSGLGLSISKQIIEAHGGAIRAENRVEPNPQEHDQSEPKIPGARFIVELPAV